MVGFPRTRLIIYTLIFVTSTLAGNPFGLFGLTIFSISQTMLLKDLMSTFLSLRATCIFALSLFPSDGMRLTWLPGYRYCRLMHKV